MAILRRSEEDVRMNDTNDTQMSDEMRARFREAFNAPHPMDEEGA